MVPNKAKYSFTDKVCRLINEIVTDHTADMFNS
jgi:hypothetical protein